MAKADLIGWDWKIEGGELVVFPTAEAYGKYLLYLLIGPVLVLGLLSIGGVTPWGIYQGSKVSERRNPLMDENQQKQLEQFQQQTISHLGEVLGEDDIEHIIAEATEARQLRSAQRKQAQRISLLGLAIVSLVGSLWLLMIGLGTLYLGAFIRLPTATYRFSRKANGDLVVRIPHLFITSEHRIPVASIRDCVIGNYTKLVGKYGSQVQLWYVSLVPTDATQFQLPLFVITEQLPKDSTCKPHNRVIGFYKAVRQILS